MKYGIVLASLLLASCGFTPQGDLVRGVVREKGAQAYDEGVVNAEFFLCQAASVGSIRRRYGGSREMMEAYQKLCSPPDVGFVP